MQKVAQFSWLLLVVALLLIAYLLWTTDSKGDKAKDYEQTIALLNMAIGLDKEIDEKLALSRTGLLPNYDPIVKRVSELEAVLSDLAARSISETDESDREQKITRQTEQVIAKFEQKKRIIERLKSDMAVVRNSMLYLPILLLDSRADYQDEETSGAHKSDLQKLLHALNLNMQFSGDNAHWLSEINDSLERLKNLQAQDENGYIDTVGMHVLSIFEYQQRVFASIQRLDEIQFFESLETLISSNVRLLQEHKNKLEQTKLMLTLALIAMLSIVVLAFVELAKQRSRLRQENLHRGRINSALSKLAEFNQTEQEHNFFEACTLNLAATCDCHVAFVAMFEDPERTRLKTESVFVGDSLQENFDYDLENTPCENVVKSGACFVEKGAAGRFSQSLFMKNLGIQSYFGKVILDATGMPAGVVSLMYKQARPAEDWVKSLLDIFVTRISIEIERDKNLRALAEQRDQVVTTLHSIADGVIATDPDGIIQSINPAAAKMLETGDSQAEIGQPANSLFKVMIMADGENTIDPVARCLETRQTIIHEGQSVLAASGKSLAAQLSAAPIINAEGRLLGSIIVLHDVSHERKHQSELTYLANHDDLTGLLNRRALELQLENLLRLRNPGDVHSLMYLDLDRFKIVNDTCGHKAGDEMLRKITALLRERVRANDLLARLGGDEFMFVLKNCPLEQCQTIARQILADLQKFRFFWEGNEFSISGSIGLMSLESGNFDVNELISMVDLSCLEAKNLGRNRICTTEPDNPAFSRQQNEMLWVPKLRNAVEQNWLELYQQPIIELKGFGEAPQRPLEKVEILLRVKDYENRKIELHQFISAAERSGNMQEIDRWVISNVIARMALNPESADGRGLTNTQLVSINLSAQSLTDESLPHFIRQQIETHAVDPKRLCFEITETGAIANFNSAERLMTELKQDGCRFALDDFGSGLSSYAYIKRLPADFLKIDAEFTKNLAEEEINRAIVQSIIDVARNIGMLSVAEGVETAETLNTLIEFGVDYAQGYHLGYPEPVDNTKISLSELS